LKKRETTSSVDEYSRNSTLIAARRPMCLCFARYTAPIPPTPSCRRIVYAPTLSPWTNKGPHLPLCRNFITCHPTSRRHRSTRGVHASDGSVSACSGETPKRLDRPVPPGSWRERQLSFAGRTEEGDRRRVFRAHGGHSDIRTVLTGHDVLVYELHHGEGRSASATH
jgi:hypothetical protein